MQDIITVAILEPYTETALRSIPNTLEALQGIVGGYIEVHASFGGDGVIICNEEGRLIGLDPCCTIDGVDYVGPVVIAGVDGEHFASLPEWIARVLNLIA